MATPPKNRDADRARILELHAEGKGRNAIRELTGFGAGFISETVADAGGTFVRSDQVKAATAARAIDNKTRRVAIVARLYGQAEAVLSRLEAPDSYETIMKGEGGAEHVSQVGFIPPVDRKNELTAVGISLDKALKLEALDTDGGTERAESMLDRLSADMKEAAQNALRNVSKADPDDSDL